MIQLKLPEVNELPLYKINDPCPDGAGIYFLLNAEKEVVYVGQSIRISQRIQHHNLKAFFLKEIIYITWVLQKDISIGIHSAEAVYKEHYNPKYNNTMWNETAWKVEKKQEFSLELFGGDVEKMRDYLNKHHPAFMEKW